MSESAWQLLFRIAAISNWVAALLMFTRPAMFGVGQTSSFVIQLLAAFVVIFGYMYWRVATDLWNKRDYVWFGLIGKVMAVSIILINTYLGYGSKEIMIIGSADLLFAALFLWFLVHARRTQD